MEASTVRKSGQPTWHLLAMCRFIERRLDEEEAAAVWAQAEFDRNQPTRLLGVDPVWMQRFVDAGRCMVENYRGLIERIDAEPDWQVRERIALTRHGLDMWAHQYATLWSDHPEYEDSFRP